MSAEVPEDRKLPVAVTYLDPKRLDWFTVAIPDNKKPRDWEGLKRLLKCHFGATSERDAREQLLRVKQTTTVQDYLWRFNEAVTDCPTLKEDEKMELFIDNLKAEIAEAVEAKSPHDLEDAIREAVRAEGRINRRDSARRANRTAPEHAIMRSCRPERTDERPRDSRAPAPQIGRRHVGYVPPHMRQGQWNGRQDFVPFSKSPARWLYASPREIQAVQDRRREAARRSEPRGAPEAQPLARPVKKENASSTVRCFGCGETGHYKSQCPEKLVN